MSSFTEVVKVAEKKNDMSSYRAKVSERIASNK